LYFWLKNQDFGALENFDMATKSAILKSKSQVKRSKTAKNELYESFMALLHSLNLIRRI